MNAKEYRETVAMLGQRVDQDVALVRTWAEGECLCALLALADDIVQGDDWHGRITPKDLSVVRTLAVIKLRELAFGLLDRTGRTGEGCDHET